MAATAQALVGDVVHTAVIDTEGFRFGTITQYDDVDFLAVKYGFAWYLALNAPHRLIVVGEEPPAFTKHIRS